MKYLVLFFLIFNIFDNCSSNNLRTININNVCPNFGFIDIDSASKDSDFIEIINYAGSVVEKVPILYISKANTIQDDNKYRRFIEYNYRLCQKPSPNLDKIPFHTKQNRLANENEEKNIQARESLIGSTPKDSIQELSFLDMNFYKNRQFDESSKMFFLAHFNGNENDDIFNEISTLDSKEFLKLESTLQQERKKTHILVSKFVQFDSSAKNEPYLWYDNKTKAIFLELGLQEGKIPALPVKGAIQEYGNYFALDQNQPIKINIPNADIQSVVNSRNIKFEIIFKIIPYFGKAKEYVCFADSQRYFVYGYADEGRACTLTGKIPKYKTFLVKNVKGNLIVDDRIYQIK